MSAEEYGLWMADYAAEQWGEQRMDIGFAVVASTMANVHRKSGTAAYPLSDFMPFARQEEAEADDATPAEFLKSIGHG